MPLSIEYSLYLCVTPPPTQALFDPGAGVPNLVKLVARHNALRNLPRSLGRLGQLVLLDVSHNHLDALPPLE